MQNAKQQFRAEIKVTLFDEHGNNTTQLTAKQLYVVKQQMFADKLMELAFRECEDISDVIGDIDVDVHALWDEAELKAKQMLVLL